MELKGLERWRLFIPIRIAHLAHTPKKFSNFLATFRVPAQTLHRYDVMTS